MPTPEEIASQTLRAHGIRAAHVLSGQRVQALLVEAIEADRAQAPERRVIVAPTTTHVERGRLPGYDLDEHSDRL